jgi:hypothetical protein
VRESVKLLLSCRPHLAGAMTDVHAPDAAAEIQKGIAIHVVKDGTFGVMNKDRNGMVYATWDCLLASSHPFL